MSINTTTLYNHNIRYTNANELMAELTRRTGLPVVDNVQDYTSDADYLLFSEEEGVCLQDFMDKRALIEFHLMSKALPGYCCLNPYVMENLLTGFDSERWRWTVDLCELIRACGLRKASEYKELGPLSAGYEDGIYVLECREQRIPLLPRFGSRRSLTFCGDHHTDYVDHIAANWSFEDFVSWGRKEFIYVDFKDLPYFDFPANPRDYYRVMIHDGFEEDA